MHDHFRLLLDALPTSQAPASTQPLHLDYDIRLRSPLEESASTAIAELEVAQQRLRDAFAIEQVSGRAGGKEEAAAAQLLVQRKLLLKATTPMSVAFESTVGREVSDERDSCFQRSSMRALSKRATHARMAPLSTSCGLSVCTLSIIWLS